MRPATTACARTEAQGCTVSGRKEWCERGEHCRYRCGSVRCLVHRAGGSRHRGVEAEVGLEEAAVDIEIIVDFGHPIRQVAERMREHVIETVERMTGCRMVEVDIHVVDVNLPKVDRRPRRQLA